MNRKSMLLTVFMLLTSSVFVLQEPVSSAESSSENILFIQIDDMNQWGFPLTQHPDVLLPNIKSLSEDGMTFENHRVNGVVCNSSRISLHTGLRPSSTGILANGQPYEQWRQYLADPTSEAQNNYGAGIENIKTITEHFADEGYFVGGVGKIYHREIGFDGSSQNEFGKITIENNGYDGTSHYERVSNSPWPSGLENYPLRNLPADLDSEIKYVANDWGTIESAEKKSAPGTFFSESDLSDHLVGSKSVELLDRYLTETDSNGQALSDKPFFITTGFFGPHAPWYVPQRILDQYKDADGGFSEIDLPKDWLDNDRDDLPFDNIRDTSFLSDDQEAQKFIAHYLASITYADEQVGKVIDKLKSEGLYESTTIVLWSDHGHHIGDKRAAGEDGEQDGLFGKETLWDNTVRTPLIVKSPLVENPDSISDAQISSVDIFPTLAEIASIGMPNDFTRDGRSFKRLLSGNDTHWPFRTASYALPISGGQVSNQAVGVRDKNWSYMLHYLNKDPDGTAPIFREELYELQEDPDEFHNLIETDGTTEHQTIREELFAAAVGDGFNSETGYGGLYQPNEPPSSVSIQDIEVNDASSSVPIELRGDDPNNEGLAFRIVGLPSKGVVYESFNGIDPASEILSSRYIHSETGKDSTQIIYQAEELSPGTCDQIDFEVSDGSLKDSGSFNICNTDNDAKSDITVKVRGRTGSEDIFLSLNGTIVKSWNDIGKQDISLKHVVSEPTTIDEIKVGLVDGSRNDLGDQDAYIDYLEIDGEVFETEDPANESKGSWSSDSGCGQGYKSSQALHCNNAWVHYAEASNLELATNDSFDIVTVKARGSIGTEVMGIEINGETVASFDLTTKYTSYSYALENSIAINSFKVTLVDGSILPAGDQNAYIDHVVFGGEVFETEDPANESKGSWSSGSGCGQGYKSSQALHCSNAWVRYGITSP